jgi:hypothetical protein
MTAIKNPMIDAEMDDQTRMYVAVLERRLIGLTIAVAKYQAVISVITGEVQEDVITDFEDAEVKKLCIEAVQKKFDVSAREAKKIVEERLKANPVKVVVTE